VKAIQKRDLLVKEILKPMLKQAGFKTKKLNWWKELEDGYLFITMKNSIFNSPETGCSFCFQFSASYKGDIREKLENQWIYNQSDCIEEPEFLPYMGYLAPNRDGLRGYQIDGYRNGQPLDIPIEEIFVRVKEDFEIHILPHLTQIQCVRDFYNLKEMLRERQDTKENNLLNFYSMMHLLCCDEVNLQHAVQIYEGCLLPPEYIRSHYDWLDVIAHNSAFPQLDAREFIEKILLMHENFV